MEFGVVFRLGPGEEVADGQSLLAEDSLLALVDEVAEGVLVGFEEAHGYLEVAPIGREFLGFGSMLQAAEFCLLSFVGGEGTSRQDDGTGVERRSNTTRAIRTVAFTWTHSGPNHLDHYIMNNPNHCILG